MFDWPARMKALIGRSADVCAARAIGPSRTANARVKGGAIAGMSMCISQNFRLEVTITVVPGIQRVPPDCATPAAVRAVTRMRPS